MLLGDHARHAAADNDYGFSAHTTSFIEVPVTGDIPQAPADGRRGSGGCHSGDGTVIMDRPHRYVNY
jgi:hypothetical protein